MSFPQMVRNSSTCEGVGSDSLSLLGPAPPAADDDIVADMAGLFLRGPRQGRLPGI